VLHPGLKWKWLEKVWRGRPSWISRARVEVNKLWLEYSDITVTTEDTECLEVEAVLAEDISSSISLIELQAILVATWKNCREKLGSGFYFSKALRVTD
jgi:hypothetical protein